MSTAEFAQKVVSMVHQAAPANGTALDFEMAYQARVAADRIRFAIRQIDQRSPSSDQLREASMQLLDALDRLASADNRFQGAWRACGQKDSRIVDHGQPDGRPFFE